MFSAPIPPPIMTLYDTDRNEQREELQMGFSSLPTTQSHHSH